MVGPDALPEGLGSYLLVLRVSQPLSISIGRLGRLDAGPGYFYYSGSAFGPGGLRARVGRHLRQSKKHHWHIDYLRTHCEVVGILIAQSKTNMEHKWSTRLLESDLFSAPLAGFGASDCQCVTHLAFSKYVGPAELALPESLYFPANIVRA